MEKSVKLLRYDRKDYTELVEFPVEIVGRDGVVRRYSFEDSIRLYQRRISFAGNRYRDPDLARAEVHHCRSRIEQLRRSYFHRQGWGSADGLRAAELYFGDLAGELAAFVCRVFGTDDRPSIRFEPVGGSAAADEEEPSTWFLRIEGVSGGMLLYFHRFDGLRADAVRDRFFVLLKQLEGHGAHGEDVEKLVAFHHTHDCGFVLTGRAADREAFPVVRSVPDPVDLGSVDVGPIVLPADASPLLGEAIVGIEPPRRTPPGEPFEVRGEEGPGRDGANPASPWEAALDLIRRGDYEEALRRCRDIVRQQPWHRSAYVGGAMIATYLGEHHIGDSLAEVGCRYFPDDAVLRYYLGLCRARLGRRAESEAALLAALERAPDLVAARALLAVERLRRGRLRGGLQVLRARRGILADDRKIETDLRWIERAQRWPQWGLAVFVLASIAAVLLAFVARSPLPLWLAAVGLAAERVAAFVFRRHVDAYTSRRRMDEIAHGLRLIHRRARIPLRS